MTSVLAPAKLTLDLHVTGIRADGFHLLSSEMVTVDLCDQLDIDPDGQGLDITGDDVGPIPGAGADNLVNRALRAVGASAGIRLTKRIPMGAGLGGGSADAAAILRWFGCYDLELAARLGADVPFCVTGGRARVSGIGEQIEPLDYTERHFVLVTPPLAVNTAAVYRRYDELGAPEHPRNDLEPAAFSLVPELARWKEHLGAVCGVEPALAGSGSTLYVEGRLGDFPHIGESPPAVSRRAKVSEVVTVAAFTAGS